MERQSVLDDKASHVFGFPLTIKQQLWLSFFLPTICLLLIYITDIATDITVGILLIGERKTLQGGLTLAIVYIPPLLTYLSRLSNPPETKEVPVVFAWFFIETAAFILFPIRILQCIGERLFWSIEALRLKDPEREEALEEYERTRCHLIEYLLFTQAYLHAGPQAVLQAVFLANHLSKHLPTEIMEGVCVISSIGTMALVTCWYERYESQLQSGRYQVWSPITPEPTKAMEEDNPIGRLCSFLFWFVFISARITSIAVASFFYPKIALAVIASHYLLSLIHLFSLPPYRTSILFKIFLSVVYIFCIVEVRIKLRKIKIFYTIYYSVTILENVCLTILWTTQSKWSGLFYYYIVYTIAITHILAFLFLLIYNGFLKPAVKRIEG